MRGLRGSAVSGVAVLAAMVFGVSCVAIATRWGIGSSPDSAAYLGAAANLRRGLGLTLPYGAGGSLTQFPPLYPIGLALAGAVAGDLGSGARWAQALLMAGNIIIVAALLVRVGRWASYAGIAFMVTALPMVLIHSMAWSEALFIFLGFSGILVLGRGLDRSRRSFIWAAAALFGLACLTRLVGLAFVLTGVLGILLQPRRLGRKAVRAGAFGLVASLPILGWLAWSAATTGSLANRTLGLHLIGRTQLQQAVGTMAGWFLLPQDLPGLAKGVVLVAVGLATVGLVWLPLRRRTASPADSSADAQPWQPTELRLVTIFVLTYVAVLGAATSLLDANVPWDDRILSPLFVATVILGAAAVDRVLTMGLARRGTLASWLAPMIILLIAVWVVGVAVRSADYLATAYDEGLGFRHRIWRQSQTVARLGSLAQDTVIYSNSPEAVYLYTGRAARFLPRQEFYMGDRTNPSYAAELAGLEQTLHEAVGAIVYFDAVPARSFPSLDELSQGLGPVHVDRAADGVILTPAVAAESY